MSRHSVLLALCIISLFSFVFTEDLRSAKALNSEKSIARAMSDVIREFFIANNIQFDFIIFGEFTTHIKDVINEVTKEISDEIPLNIFHIRKIQEWDFKLAQSAIFFMTSKIHFEYFHHKAIYDPESTNIPKKIKFLIYTEKMDFNSMRELMFDFKIYEQNSNMDLKVFELFMINEGDSVSLIANVLYSEFDCGVFHLLMLNTFDKNSQNWEEKLENFNHLDNFHGCMLTFLAFYNIGPHWYFDEFKRYDKNRSLFQEALTNGEIIFRGLTHEIIELSASKYNFTLHYIIEIDVDQKLIYFGHKNYIHSKDDVICLVNTFSDSRKIQLLLSEPTGSISFYYLLSKNDLYSNYEKLLMPFDFATWILLSLTIGCTFIVIFGSFKFPQWIKTRLHGKGIRNPAYNTLGVIFGIAQLKLPKESVNRAALLLFIWFCLLFRTCYQSMLFKFMTSDMRKPLPASINDLKEMNYTIVLLDELKINYDHINDELLNGIDKPNIKKSEDFFNLYKRAVNDTLDIKLAFLVNSMLHSKLNKTYQSLAMMENIKLNRVTGYYVESNNMMMNQFIPIIHQLIPSGIAQHLESYAMWLLQRPKDLEIIDPRKTLSLSDLEFGFVLWLISLSLPITCFLFEILTIYYKKLKTTVREIMMFAKATIIENIFKLFIERFQNRW